MSNKPKSPFIARTRTEGLIGGGIFLCVTILVGVLFGEDRGWIAGDSAGALAGLILFSWPLRKERWFWVAVVCFTAVNAFAVAHFDWTFTHPWSGRAVASLMILDLVVMLAITYGLYCLIYGRPSESIAVLPDDGPSYSERDLDL